MADAAEQSEAQGEEEQYQRSENDEDGNDYDA
jgi:hypothetical protein